MTSSRVEYELWDQPVRKATPRHQDIQTPLLVTFAAEAASTAICGSRSDSVFSPDFQAMNVFDDLSDASVRDVCSDGSVNSNMWQPQQFNVSPWFSGCRCL